MKTKTNKPTNELKNLIGSEFYDDVSGKRRLFRISAVHRIQSSREAEKVIMIVIFHRVHQKTGQSFGKSHGMGIETFRKYYKVRTTAP